MTRPWDLTDAAPNDIYNPDHIVMDIIRYAKYQHGQVRDCLLQSLLDEKCCVLLGYPGSGKTVMTADLIKTLITDHDKSVTVTGSTGSAAQQIKTLLPEMDLRVQTAHSFLGFRQKESALIEKGDMEAFEKHVRRQFMMPWMQDKRQDMVECDVLIIDEISMLTSEFIHAIDITLKVVRGCPSKKFSGLTVLLIGDYRQLPPVNVAKSKYPYPFLHPLWKEGRWVDKIFCLEHILRQADDMSYGDMILGLSHNCLSVEDERKLAGRVVPDGRQKIMDISFLPDALRVFHFNNDVNRYNEAVTTKAIHEGRHHETLKIKWDMPKEKDCKKEAGQLCKDMVFSNQIFVGAHVIITANMDIGSGLVNGTAGRVLHIESTLPRSTPIFGGRDLSVFVTLKLGNHKIIKLGCHTIHHMVEKENKDVPSQVIKAHYIPLLLSHAITVHRLQGCTVKRPLFYMPKCMGPYCTEFYVIATRVTCLDNLYLTHVPYNLSNVVDPKVVSFYDTLYKNK
jgi:hypothetical protein